MDLEIVNVQIGFKAKRLQEIIKRVSLNRQEARTKDCILRYSNFQSQEDDEPENKNSQLKEKEKNMVPVGTQNGHWFQMILKVKFKKD